MAAESAAGWIKDGMVVGLGTGSTAYWAIQKIADRVREGLRIKAVATSVQTEKLASQQGISLVPFSKINGIDLTIDGADEVNPAGDLIKGGGGALLREKLVAYHSASYFIVVDESKLVPALGRFPLPVEVLPFGAELTLRHLEKQFGPAVLRQANGKIFLTDNGNYIADLRLYPIHDPEALNNRLHSVPGVVETGLFRNQMVTRVMVGKSDGTVEVKSFRQ